MSIKDIINDKEKIYKLSKSAFDAIDATKTGYLERADLEAVITAISPEFDFDQSSKEDVDEI